MHQAPSIIQLKAYKYGYYLDISKYRKPSINTTLIIRVKLFVTTAQLARGQTLVITEKIGARNGYKIISESVQNVLACKCIAPMGIQVVSASVKNILTYIKTLHPWE